MSDQFLGQLLLVGFDFAPYQWALAAGQIMPISQNTALFALLGVKYGGNGTSNFALPNLMGNCAMGQGNSLGGSSYVVGESGGSENVTLSYQQMPSHTHAAMGGVSRTETTDPTNAAFGGADNNVYNADTQLTTTPMNAGALTPFTGGNLPHNNMMPYLAMNWIIALQGVFPTRD
jgi:microcystin-dependent protein